MLERRRFLITESPGPTPGRGTGTPQYCVSDGDTNEPVGDATLARPCRNGWLAWMPAADRARGPLEVREPPDGSLVFALARPTFREPFVQLTDGQDIPVWRFTPVARGITVAAARGGAAARVGPCRARRLFTVTTPAGARMGEIARGPKSSRVELAPELDGQPFEKMLVLGAAFAILMLVPPPRR